MANLLQNLEFERHPDIRDHLEEIRHRFDPFFPVRQKDVVEGLLVDGQLLFVLSLEPGFTADMTDLVGR